MGVKKFSLSDFGAYYLTSKEFENSTKCQNHGASLCAAAAASANFGSFCAPFEFINYKVN
jgi:hypothetical protein